MPRLKDNYFTTKEIVEAASLPIHLFRVQAERSCKRVSHLLQREGVEIGVEQLVRGEQRNQGGRGGFYGDLPTETSWTLRRGCAAAILVQLMEQVS
ncbi:MAG: hypothetical protein M0Z44_05910 [Gammaproteobacteria bacterium]|nr:hypothetical protein [Gammaproteobacteria bacterium]